MDELIIPTPEPQPEAMTAPTAPHPITRAVKSPLFLTVAILLSISVGIDTLTSLANGSLWVNITSLLIMIGMWIAYANAQKTPVEAAIPANGLNMVSGTVKALRIISLVLAIIFIVVGIFLCILGPVANVNENVYNGFKEGYLEGLGDQVLIMTNGETILDLRDLVETPAVAMTLLLVIGIGFIVTAIFLLVVYYFLFFKTAHRFTYSVCENVKHGTPIEKARSLWVWLMVLGIIAAIFSLSNPLVGGTSAAAQIVSALLVRKYFCN